MTAVGASASGGATSRPQTHNPLFAVVAVMIGAFLTGIQSRLFSMGLQDIKGGLQLGFDEGSWFSTIATASQILVAPATAWLVVTFGLRRVFGAPIILFALVALAIPFFRDFRILMVLQFVHGAMLALIIPATLGVIMRTLPPSWWIAALSIYALRLPITSNGSIYIEGLYSQTIGWQWIYWQDAILAPIMGMLAWLGSQPSQPVDGETLRRADWGGMALFGSACALLYCGLDQGNRLDWMRSGTVVVLLAGGGILAAGFFLNEALVREPWAHISVLKRRNIGLMLLADILFMLAAASNTSLIPTFLTTVQHFRPEQIGPVFVQFAVIPLIVVTVIAGVLLHFMDARYLVILGFGAFAIAALLGTTLTSDFAPETFALMLVIQAIGFGTAFVSLIIFGITNADMTKSTSFSAYVQFVRLGFAEISIAIMSTFLRVQEQTYSNIVGLNIQSGSPQINQRIEQLSAPYMAVGPDTALAKGVGALKSIVTGQAYVLAYIDGYWLCFIASVAGLVVMSLTSPSPPGPLTPGRK